MISTVALLMPMAAVIAPATLNIVIRSAAPWCGAAIATTARNNIALARSVKCGYFLLSISWFPFCVFEFVF